MPNTVIEVRPETPDDILAIRVVHDRAFGSSTERRLVDSLRASDRYLASLVAVRENQIVGHVMFSPVTVECAPCDVSAVGLAPMAVLPEFQRTGIGSRLVRAGLVMCERSQVDVVVVLGHVGYYSRVGFVPASAHGLQSEYHAGDAFMVRELTAGALEAVSGLVRFAPDFQAVGC